MEAFWYAIVAAMLTTWAVLDGFDFGAGMVHRLLAKTEEERGMVISAIGPVWDGNEVWLLASGGIFVFAFPLAYAAAMSGMYLAIMLVLWLLVLRGIAIELRSQFGNVLWRAGWDSVFAYSSAALALVAGVALGNLVRGLPVDATGHFHLDLFATHAHPGAIDLYTLLVGVFALVTLLAHGTTYVAWKTSGELSDRCVRQAGRMWVGVIVLLVVVTIFTAIVQPAIYASLGARPWAWPLPAITIISLIVVLRAVARRQELTAFLASCAVIASLILATAAVLYPALLLSTIDRRYDVTAHGAASGQIGMQLGLLWWGPAIALAILYFINLFRSFRGKVRAGLYGH